jgi:hypothetical protein
MKIARHDANASFASGPKVLMGCIHQLVCLGYAGVDGSQCDPFADAFMARSRRPYETMAAWQAAAALRPRAFERESLWLRWGLGFTRVQPPCWPG